MNLMLPVRVNVIQHHLGSFQDRLMMFLRRAQGLPEGWLPETDPRGLWVRQRLLDAFCQVLTHVYGHYTAPVDYQELLVDYFIIPHWSASPTRHYSLNDREFTAAQPAVDITSSGSWNGHQDSGYQPDPLEVQELAFYMEMVFSSLIRELNPGIVKLQGELLMAGKELEEVVIDTIPGSMDILAFIFRATDSDLVFAVEF